MEEYRIKTDAPHHNGANSTNQKGFRRATTLLVLMVTGGIITQNIQGLILQNGLSMAGLAVAGLAIAGVLGLAFFKPFYRHIDSPHFAISSLLAIAVGTAMGTFVTQNATPEVFTQRYGETRSMVFRFFQLDDLFHSWWYVGFFILLAVSLLKISLKKKWSWENLGFHLAHLSPIVILLGFWADYFYGYRGIIQLEEGQSKKTVMLYDAQQKNIRDSVDLDFSIRLDNFEFERHDPDYRIQVWRQDTTDHAQKVSHDNPVNEAPPQIVASIPAEEMVIRHIYGTDIYFRVSKLFPNFEFKYSYPSVIDTIEAKDPGIQMDIKMPDGETALLQLRTNKSGKNKLMDLETFGGWLEFYWDLPADVKAQLDQPAKSEEGRIIFAGAKRQVLFLFNGELKTEALELNKFYPVPGKENTGFTIQFLFPDAAYLSAEPSTRDEKMENPVAMMEYWHKGQSANNYYLYPGTAHRKAGTYQIQGSPYFMAFESMKDRETKYYKSDLSVIGPSGEVVKQQAIKVNEPMLYDGYRFYQTDYDPQNPSYSGIGVTHDPGLYVIYAGFIILVLGVGLMFYGKHAKGHTKGEEWAANH